MDLNYILGPILLAVVANATLYGICVVQWYNYYTSGYKDPALTQLLVLWVILIDTFQTGSTAYMLWDFTVTNFGNLAVFANVPWPYPTTPIFSLVRRISKAVLIIADIQKPFRASVPIQHFLAYRIKSLSRSWILFLIVSIFSLAQGAFGIAGGILATVVSNPSDFRSLIPIANAWISLAVFTDVLITCLLFFFLHKSKTGFRRMDSIIERLIRTAVETAFIGAAFCVVDVIVFNVKGNTNLHYFFALLQGRIYTNTLMVTLNSRANLREKMGSNEVQGLNTQAGTVRFKTTEVSIAVQQDIQMDAMRPESEGSVDHKIFYPV